MKNAIEINLEMGMPTAPNKNKTNLDKKSKFVLFFTRDYFGIEVKR